MVRLYFVCLQNNNKNISVPLKEYVEDGLPMRVRALCRHCGEQHTYSRSDIKRVVSVKNPPGKKLSR
jgi:hypothetical protein